MNSLLSVGLIFFNDKDSLKRCLDSIPSDIRKICIDGRFTDPPYSHHTDLSDDGSRELVQSYPNTALIDCPGTEVQKRNKYFELCQTEWLLHMDSDEYAAETDWPAFLENLSKVGGGTDVASIMYQYPESKTPDTVNRLFRHPRKFHYDILHNRLKEKGMIYSITNMPVIEGITLTQDDKLRSVQRFKEHRRYQSQLVAKERAIKRSWR